MRCSVARLCERTVGRRVPLLGAGGGQLHTTPHCVVVTALGAELRGFAEHTGRAVHSGGCGAAAMSSTLPSGRGGSGRSIPTAGNGAEPSSFATSWGMFVMHLHRVESNA